MTVVGSDYPRIEAGQDKTDATGRFDVVFPTPFPGKGYSIQVSCKGFYIVTWTNKGAAGFRIRSRDTSGANAPDVTVSWTATKNVSS